MEPRRARSPARSPRPSLSSRTRVRKASWQAVVTVRKYAVLRKRWSPRAVPAMIWRVIRFAIASVSERRRRVTSGGSVAVPDKLSSRDLATWATLFSMHKNWPSNNTVTAEALAGVANYRHRHDLRRSLHSAGASPLAAEHRHPLRHDRPFAGQRPVALRPAPDLPHRVERALRHRDVPPRLLCGHRFLQLHLDLVLRGGEAPPHASKVPRGAGRDLRRSGAAVAAPHIRTWAGHRDADDALLRRTAVGTLVHGVFRACA